MDIRLCGSDQPEVVLPALQDPVLLHPREFLGHVGPFQIQVVGQLLPVKRNVEFRRMLLKGNGIQIR